MPLISVTSEGALRKSTLRQANERLVLDAIRQNQKISRADLVRITGFSPSSVTFIVNRLLKNNLVCEEERRDGQAQIGRPPVSLRLRPEALMSVGVHIAASASRVALCDVDGQLVGECFITREPDAGSHLGAIRAAIRRLTNRIEPRNILGVGVSLPGLIDRVTGHVIAAENQGWFDLPAGRILRDGLPFKFFFENDAKLLALAQRWFAPAGEPPLDNFVLVGMGEGLGAGVIMNGRLLHGARGIASEFGHTMLFPDGRPCVCGNRGCWEEYASERALRRLYAELSGAGNGAGIPDGAAITGLARQGEALALRVWEETAVNLSLGFANLIMALMPEAIVAGGLLSEAWPLIEDKVWEVLRSRVPDYYLAGIRIFPSRHAAEASLLGAVALVLANFFTVSGPQNPPEAKASAAIA